MGNQVTTLRMGQGFKKTPAGEIPVDWDVYSLKDLAKGFLNGGTPDTKVKEYWTGDIPWITGADFIDQKVSRFRRFISEEAIQNSATNRVPEGTILIVTRTGVGKVAIAPRDLAISQDITAVVLNDLATPQFLYWTLVLNAERLGAVHQGTSINGILRADLENLLLAVPPMREQERICEILTAVDEAISKTDASIGVMHKLKQGLIQEAFVRLPHQMRWKMSSVGECARINAETLKESTPPDAMIQYLDISSVSDRGISQTKEISFRDAPSRARRVVGSGDILVSTVRPYLRAFAKMGAAPDNLIASTGFAVLRPQPGVDADFLYQFIRSDRFVNFLVERMTGSNYPAVSASDVAECPIPLPSSEEQRAIGERLLAIDQAITQADESRNRFELMRAGLIRGLLTGRLRVTT